MSNFFNDLARRRPDLLKKPAQVSVNLPGNAPSAFEFDLHGQIDRLIADEVARQVHGTLAPEKAPLPARVERLLRSMQKAHAGVPKPAPSRVDAPAPVSVDAPAPFAVPMDVGRGANAREVVVWSQRPLPMGSKVTMQILDRDRRGGIWHTRFDTPDGQSYIGTVSERDANNRVAAVMFERVS